MYHELYEILSIEKSLVEVVVFVKYEEKDVPNEEWPFLMLTTLLMQQCVWIWKAQKIS